MLYLDADCQHGESECTMLNRTLAILAAFSHSNK